MKKVNPGIKKGFDNTTSTDFGSVSCPLSKYNTYLDYGADAIFELVGTGESYDNCGELKAVLQCPNGEDEEGHHHEKVHHNCGRWLCSTCYKYPAKKEAKKIAERLYEMRRSYRDNGYNLGRIDHWVFSPPQEEAEFHLKTVEDYKKLRKYAYKLMRDYGLYGGVVIFHRWRQDENTGKWYKSPHFHVLGCGYMEKSDKFYEETGWVYKKKDKRDTIEGTAFYLLTHCAVILKEDRADPAYTYFGCFAYNKAKVEEEREPDYLTCDKCGEEVIEYAVYDDGNYLESVGPKRIVKIRRYYYVKGPPVRDWCCVYE